MKIFLTLLLILSNLSFAKDNCEKLFWRSFYVDNIIVEAGERSGLEVDSFVTFLNNANKSQIKDMNSALRTMRKQKNYKTWQGDRAFDKIYDLVYGKVGGKGKSWVQNLRAKGLLDSVKTDADELVVNYVRR